MFVVDAVILTVGVLLLLGIASSKFSARLGLPVLVLFVALGMLAGSEGPGGIDFEDYTLAHAIGTLALAIILFDGGLRSRVADLRPVWKPAILMATLGVVITSVVTGLVTAWVLGASALEGLLLGSIVGSTDASAVFAVLRSGGVHLPKRLAATLEFESGSNDPMAVFLTVGLIEVLAGRMALGPGLLALFVTQMVVGGLVGFAIGATAVWVVNRINLDVGGLYPVFITACALFTFGLAASLSGSGFLAVYIAGVIIGNSRIVYRRGVFLFHDASAWLAQIVMFVVLGLLSFPSRVLDAAGPGLLIALVLIFVARPAAVALTLWPFRFSWRELAFLSWVGLKGAVPITLATFPLLLGIGEALHVFDLVFFVVLVSALAQGWTLPYVARWLGLETPAEPKAPVTLEISSLRDVDADIVDYLVDDDSLVAGRMVKQLALPEGVVIAMIAREHKITPPHGNTRILAGDHVIVVLHPDARPLVNKIFGRASAPQEEVPVLSEFPLRGSTKVGELEAFYGFHLGASPDSTLDEAVRARLEGRPEIGASVDFGRIALSVRGLTDEGTVATVGMLILPQSGDEDDLTAEAPRQDIPPPPTPDPRDPAAAPPWQGDEQRPVE